MAGKTITKQTKLSISLIPKTADKNSQDFIKNPKLMKAEPVASALGSLYQHPSQYQ